MRLDHVICRLDGGLGNQLFQYATARSLADKLACKLALDLRALGSLSARSFGLNAFGVRAELADLALLEALPSPQTSRMGRMRSGLSILLPAFAPYPVYWSSSFAFDARLLQLQQPKLLVGYWQSEHYFAWNRARILIDLQPRMDTAMDSTLLHHVRSCPSVAVHIRRGDYVTQAAAARVHGVCDPAYYHAAVQRLVQCIPGAQLFVFSDNIDWVRTHFDFGLPTTFVDGGANASPMHDFDLMRACNHHVISNSTFSWWAAWLADAPGQTVIAPKRWFADLTIPSQDVVPQRWIRM